MKANTSNSKAVTIVTNGLNLEALGETLANAGRKMGIHDEHEAAKIREMLDRMTLGITTSVLAQMQMLYVMRNDIALEASLRIYWDAYIAAAPTAYAMNKRGKQTKSDSLTIMRAWDKGAKFAFSSNGKMAAAARAFLNPEKAKAGKTEEAKAGKTEGNTVLPAEKVTPTANTAKTADAYLRLQCATLLAYCEKNKTLIPDAMRHAVAELSEAFAAVPVAEADSK